MNIRKTEGITLITLIVTIIVLLILAGITIASTLGENGIINKTKVVAENQKIAQITEKLELNKATVAMESNGEITLLAYLEQIKQEKIIKDEDIEQTEDPNAVNIVVDGKYVYLIEELENKDVKITYLGVVGKLPLKIMEVEITNTLSSITIKVNAKRAEDAEYRYYIKESSSLEAYQEKEKSKKEEYTYENLEQGKEYNIKVEVENEFSKDEKELNNVIVKEEDSLINIIKNTNLEDGIHEIKIKEETYNIEVYNFYEDVNYDTTPTLGNNTADNTMLVLKYHKNLTIGESVILTPQVRKKGMLLCVIGELENNGTISMTARGAIAEGQNIYLWKNADKSYEYVPKIGAQGGENLYSSVSIYGDDGKSGINRQTGGGGSGSIFKYNLGAGYLGAGATGTSYSGGSGGGGISLNKSGNWSGYLGTANGGAGGAGRSIRASNSTNVYSGAGGAGNPGGKGSAYSVPNSAYDGSNGTGGLLIIYSNAIINNGKVESNGSKGGKGIESGKGEAAGGSSGAGSINIFYIEDSLLRNLEAISPRMGNGGAGGNGSIITGTIKTGTFTVQP